MGVAAACADYRMRESLLNSAIHAIARRWRNRRRFARLRDWIMTLYDALLRYARRIPLPLRGRVWAIRLAGEDRPIFLRLGSSDGFVMEEIFLTGVYQAVTPARLGQVRQIVDLGANVGLSVRLWLKLFDQARIIAVEPDADNFAACVRNVQASGQEHRVRLLQACAAARAGQVYLDRSAEECAIAVTDRPQGQPVQALPLEAILQQCGCEPVIDVLKLDIEGSEREVFADCASWIGRVRAIMVELHGSYTQQLLMDDLRRAGADFAIEWQSQTAGNPLLFLTARSP